MGAANARIPCLTLALALAIAAPASAGFPQSVDATVQPNGTISETSSTIPATAKSATITVKPSGGDFFSGVSTVMARTPRKRDRVLYCVGMYKAFEDAFGSDPPEKQSPSLRLLMLAACLELAFENPPPAARAAAAACPTVAATAPMRIRRSGGLFTLDVTGPVKRPKRPPLKVSCRRAGGALKIKLRPRSPRRSLRSAVGSKLAIGFHNHGTSSVPMRTTFAVG